MITNELPYLQSLFTHRKPTELELRTIIPAILEKNSRFGWSFKWNNRKNALGVCRYKTQTIELSRPYFNQLSVSEILDTILHEIAHAIAGPKAHHGPIWKSVARQLGAKPERCAAVEGVTGRYGAKYLDSDEVIDYRHRCTKGMVNGKFSFKGKRVFWFDLETGKRITKLPEERKELSPALMAKLSKMVA